jgi:hypothetical protein
MTMGRHIASLYLDYRPFGRHQPGCAAAASSQWEVTEYRWEPPYKAESEITVRLACHECGAVVLLAWKEDGEAEKATVQQEHTHADYIGYGSKPARVAGLWLHPGPSMWRGEENGPTAYYLTKTKERPRTHADVVGVVGWKMGPRGGTKWVAGTGCTDRGSIERAADGEFASRPAAVKWVVAEIDAAAKAGK